MEAWVEIDGVKEADLPAHAQDGRSGDRVSFVEGGMLHVEGGRATFVRWTDILGVVEQGGRVYVMAPWRPPAQPWLEVDRGMVGGGDGGLTRFAERLREGGGDRGYRDAVKRHRQGLSRKDLKARIIARDPVPGAMEVPSTVVLGRSYPGLGLVQALAVMGSIGVGYVGSIVLMVLAAASAGPRSGLDSLASCMIYIGFFVGLAVGAYAAKQIGVRWRARVDATLPRQRVLVLAPDGCICGFTQGVRTLKWSMIGRFGVDRIAPDYEEALVVYDPDGQAIGSVNAGFLDAPLGLVVAVAQAYRDAALG